MLTVQLIGDLLVCTTISRKDHPMSTTLTSTPTGLDAPSPGQWNVDPAHSSVGFVARHLMISKVRGSFRSFSGSITVGDDPLASSVSATVDLESVSTGDDGRDAHLRGTDFFDVAAHPTMTFISTGVRAGRDGYLLDGDLTIKGVTQPVTFDLEFDGVNRDPWG